MGMGPGPAADLEWEDVDVDAGVGMGMATGATLLAPAEQRQDPHPAELGSVSGPEQSGTASGSGCGDKANAGPMTTLSGGGQRAGMPAAEAEAGPNPGPGEEVRAVMDNIRWVAGL